MMAASICTYLSKSQLNAYVASLKHWNKDDLMNIEKSLIRVKPLEIAKND